MKIFLIIIFCALSFTSSTYVLAASSQSLKQQLNAQCGKYFDGVNATFIPGLESSLKMRQKNSPYPEKASEMRELKCRISILKRRS